MNRNLSTALKFADLCVTLNHAEILRGVSGELRRGEVTGILGPNGCGKTTLLRALCRLIKADSGSITLCGGTAETDIAALAPKALARRVSFLPQQRAVPDITAKTLVSHGRYPYLGFSRTLSNKDRTVIQNALKTAGVSAFADRRLPMLSGGERQRVFLAMLLAQNTDVILLDEPTTYTLMRTINSSSWRSSLRSKRKTKPSASSCTSFPSHSSSVTACFSWKTAKSYKAARRRSY